MRWCSRTDEAVPVASTSDGHRLARISHDPECRIRTRTTPGRKAAARAQAQSGGNEARAAHCENAEPMARALLLSSSVTRRKESSRARARSVQHSAGFDSTEVLPRGSNDPFCCRSSSSFDDCRRKRVHGPTYAVTESRRGPVPNPRNGMHDERRVLQSLVRQWCVRNTRRVTRAKAQMMFDSSLLAHGGSFGSVARAAAAPVVPAPRNQLMCPYHWGWATGGFRTLSSAEAAFFGTRVLETLGLSRRVRMAGRLQR